MEEADKRFRVAIAGFGVEGRSAYAYFTGKGAVVTIYDQQKPQNAPPGVEVRVGETVFASMYGYDLIVRSPGIRPDAIGTDARVTSVTQEFFNQCPAPIIGVTGTKGKGTTASLIHLALQKAGLRSHLVGNIGVAALDILDTLTANDIVVYELSSFQLWDLTISPHIAVVLMVEPEHLDVHKDISEYIEAKRAITAYQTDEDITIYLPDNKLTRDIALHGAGRKLPYTQAPGAHVEQHGIVIDGRPVCGVDELRLRGYHNLQNACAAVTTVWQYTHDLTPITAALREFDGLEHRLKFVREVGGVEYYDDSIATTPGSAIAALKAFDKPKVIILGGSDKGADFTDLARQMVLGSVKKAILIGAMRHKLQSLLVAMGFTAAMELYDERTDMGTIVGSAHEAAAPGDVVLLSPACASFDMFKNYQDRGEQFIAAVNRLAKK